MEFGVRLPQDGPFAARQHLLEIGRLAEAEGYASIWVHDHIHWPLLERYHLSAGTKEAVDAAGKPPLIYESVNTLAFMAGQTDRVRLGVAAIILPLRNPLLLARQLATLQDLSDRRVICGVCLGGGHIIEDEYRMLGVPYTKRGRVMEEYLRVLRQVLFTNSAAASFQGEFASFDGFVLDPKPARFPIWYAGRSVEALDRAARLADGWIPGLNQTVARYEAELPLLDAALAKAGRRREDFTIALETFACLTDTADEAARLTAATMQVRGITDASWTFAGTPRDIQQRLEAFRRVGVQHFEIKFMVPSFEKMEADIRRFARDIMPSWI